MKSWNLSLPFVALLLSFHAETPLGATESKTKVVSPVVELGDAVVKSSDDTLEVAGWTLHVNPMLFSVEQRASTEHAMERLKAQLEEIVRVVPSSALANLQQVPLWFSPEYPGIPPRAEYHPNVNWLRENGRDPRMARGVEFTNLRIFDAETRRMPNFALHELAHAYHDRVLPKGFDNPDIKAAYEKAVASGQYDRVERKDAAGRSHLDRAYALTNPMEYFAETSEAFFSRNDFFPFTREELQRHDPEMFALLTRIWNENNDSDFSIPAPP